MYQAGEWGTVCGINFPAAGTAVENMVENGASGVGTWGGTCTCPDGSEYQVGDNNDGCGSLACIGGNPGPCSGSNPGGAGVRVRCALDNSHGAHGADAVCRQLGYLNGGAAQHQGEAWDSADGSTAAAAIRMPVQPGSRQCATGVEETLLDCPADRCPAGYHFCAQATDSTKCRDIGNDCCANQAGGEPAECADGWVPSTQPQTYDGCPNYTCLPPWGAGTRRTDFCDSDADCCACRTLWVAHYPGGAPRLRSHSHLLIAAR